jgi:hypothetical protein
MIVSRYRDNALGALAASFGLSNDIISLTL